MLVPQRHPSHPTAQASPRRARCPGGPPRGPAAEWAGAPCRGRVQPGPGASAARCSRQRRPGSSAHRSCPRRRCRNWARRRARETRGAFREAPAADAPLKVPSKMGGERPAARAGGRRAGRRAQGKPGSHGGLARLLPAGRRRPPAPARRRRILGARRAQLAVPEQGSGERPSGDRAALQPELAAGIRPGLAGVGRGEARCGGADPARGGAGWPPGGRKATFAGPPSWSPFRSLSCPFRVTLPHQPGGCSLALLPGTLRRPGLPALLQVLCWCLFVLCCYWWPRLAHFTSRETDQKGEISCLRWHR